MVTYLCRHLTNDSGGVWHTVYAMVYSMPCSSLIISEMLPEIYTMDECDFLKSIIHSQIIYFYCVSDCVVS